MSTSSSPETLDMRDGDGHALAIRVRGLVNRFGSQTVHEDLTWTCAAARSWAWSVAPVPASRC